MSVVVKANCKGNDKLFLTKGAAENIVDLCTHQLTSNNEVIKLNANDRKKVLALVTEWARQSYRVIAFAHKDVAKGNTIQLFIYTCTSIYLYLYLSFSIYLSLSFSLYI